MTIGYINQIHSIITHYILFYKFNDNNQIEFVEEMLLLIKYKDKRTYSLQSRASVATDFIRVSSTYTTTFQLHISGHQINLLHANRITQTVNSNLFTAEKIFTANWEYFFSSKNFLFLNINFKI